MVNWMDLQNLGGDRSDATELAAGCEQLHDRPTVRLALTDEGEHDIVGERELGHGW